MVIPTVPLVEIGVAASLLAPFAIASVEILKRIGLKTGSIKAAAALIMGQILAWGHYATVWPHTTEALYLVALEGIAVSAIAMGFWAKILKRIVESGNQTS